ncbi:MAG: Smr/MutS family protein [Janthinobacterium lividum]
MAKNSQTSKQAAKPQSKKSTVAIDSLAALGALRDALALAAATREQQRLEQERRARQAAEEADIFRRSVGEIRPLAAVVDRVALRRPARATLKPADILPPLPAGQLPPLPVQTLLAEHDILREALSDEFDPEHLLEADEELWFAREGISRETVRKLRRGGWVVQDQIDLHGLRRDEAREVLADFLREAVKRGIRCVRIVHGKGLGSVNREPVLKGKVRSWLTQKSEIIAFCEARSYDGGSGAVLALLRPSRAAQAAPR